MIAPVNSDLRRTLCAAQTGYDAADREDYRHSPAAVFYEVTRACDLTCRHCRVRSQTFPDLRQLPTARSKKLIDQFACFPRPPLLVITGGDPLKRPDLCELIEYGTKAGLEVAVTLRPTSRVTEEAVSELCQAGASRFEVGLDGARAETHDRLRGVPGSHGRTLEILGQFRQRDLPTQVSTTLHRSNLDQIEAVADLIAQYRVVSWSVSFLVPIGQAAGMDRLSPTQYEDAFQRLWHQSSRQPYTIRTTEAPHYGRFVLESRARRVRSPENLGIHGEPEPEASPPVNDGNGVLFVGHTGLIYPGIFFPVPCGLFPDDNVVSVYQNSPVFLALRDVDRLRGKCGVCPYRRICGGSRARAFAVTGDPYAEEPDCVYRPETVDPTVA